MARKITGMLLECDAQEKAEMLADEARMAEWVSLAMEELRRAGLLDTASIQGTTQGTVVLAWEELEETAEDAVRALRAWAGKVQDAPGDGQGLTATDAISKPVVDIYQGAARMLVIDAERCSSMTQFSAVSEPPYKHGTVIYPTKSSV